MVYIQSYRSESQQHICMSVTLVPSGKVWSFSLVHPFTYGGVPHTEEPSKRRKICITVFKFNLLWQAITFFNPLDGRVVALMHWDLVPVHLPVDGEAVVSVSARRGGGGGGEALALVSVICPYALITFPPINCNNKKARINKFAWKRSPVLINGINSTREVSKATKGAMSLLAEFCVWMWSGLWNENFLRKA